MTDEQRQIIANALLTAANYLREQGRHYAADVVVEEHVRLVGSERDRGAGAGR